LKKIFLLCLIIVLFATLSVCANESETVRDSAVYRFGEVPLNVMPGDVVSLPVYLTVTQSPVNSVQCNIAFDENVFEFQKYKSSTDKGDHVLSLGVVGIRQNNTSAVSAVFTSPDGNTVYDFNNTRLCTLRFKVKEGAASGNYGFLVTYSKVTCDNISMDKYTSEAFETEKYYVGVNFPYALRGDVNGDGKLTVVDAVSVLKYIAGTETAQNAEAADVDRDGQITVSDSVAILKYIARISSEF